MAVEDLAKDNKEGAFASFVSQQVVRPIVTSLRDMRVQRHTDPSFRALRRWYRGLVSSPEARAIIGELFYKNLFASHPDFMDYFASTDMDHLVSLFVDQLGFTLDVDLSFGALESAWHDRCAQLDRLHKRVQIPINSYSAFGGSYLKILRPLFEDEVEKLRSVGKATDKIVTVEGLEDAFSTLYVEIMGEVSPAMLVQEKIVAEAEEFLMHASKELMLSDEQLNERLLEMKLLVGANDSYSHTQDEIQVGARIACRNSMCPYNGLLSQLDVWNKGNLVTYEAMSGAIIDHLATVAAESGKDRTRKRSILVLFGPREVFDMTGTRFWTPSFTEYAGYSQDDGKILGDPRNVELTAHLIKHGLWKAPEVKSAFDMLPVVLKIPGQRPYVVPVPDGMRKEVRIEHPTCAAIAELNIRWPAFTIASSLRLCIGGVTYPCCAFNRIFFRSEVIKGICSRDGLVKQWADSMGIPQSDRLREKRALLEMEEAILHSFAGQDAVILSDDTKEDLRLQHERNEIKAGRDRSGYAPSHRVARFEGSCHSWKVSEATDNISAGLNFYASNQPSSGAVGSAEGNIPVVVIAYGSETGTGEQAALRLGRALKLLRPTVITLNDVAGLNIVKEKNVTHFIAICSTFNRGEFPSNAKEFASTALPSMALEGVKIAVLALGSMDYPDFCRAGVKLDAMLKSAGGKPFIPYTKVDGSKGSEVEISDFLRIVPKIILPAYLKAAIRGTSSQEDTLLRNEVKWLEADDEGDADASISSEGMHSFVWSKYDSLLCIGNEELFVEGDIDSRSTRRITFELPTETKYESGDHVSVHPLNSNDMVVRFAMCFKDEITDAAVASDSCPSFEDAGDKESAVVMRQLQKCVEVVTFDGDENIGAQVAFKAPAKLSHVLQARVDLTLHEGQVCDLLAMSARAFNGNGDTASEVAAQNADKASKIEEYSSSVSSIHDKNKKSSALKAFLNEYPTIVDFLEEHSFLCQREQLGKLPPLKLADVLAILPRQQARYYSISSSPIVQPTTVSISVGVVHVTTSAGIAIHGVCSNYLARLRPTIDRASIAVKTSSFRGPENPDDPLIMVGPGTGLAPMMGFLQDRAQHLAAVDPKPDTCHLFFGCRTPKDRIYGKLVDEWEANNILRHHLALSRSSEMPKTYVQDLMKQIGNELCELLRSDTARVYICGDAKIANACFEVCVDVLREHGKMSRMSAVTQIKKLRSQKRWQYDLWGSVHQFTEIKEQEVKDRSHATATSSWLKSFQ